MSKSILIVETPITCGTCKFPFYGKGIKPQCNGIKEQYTIDSWPQKPDWCPLMKLVEGEYQCDGKSLTLCKEY